MKIATYNINGVNGRLASLLQWLAQESPDVVCLQELKASTAAFPEAAIADAGYGAIWSGEKAYNGVAILAKGQQPIETRRGLPGDAKDLQSRYIEAAVNGVLIACIYLPNGNPWPGPKFEYKLAWFERLIHHAASLVNLKEPAVIAGDFNVVPTDHVADIYNTRSWLKNALLQPESREAYRRLLAQGWTDAMAREASRAAAMKNRAKQRAEPMYTFWDYFRQHWQRNAGLRIDHLLLNAPAAERLKAVGVDRYLRGQERASDHAPAWVTLKRAPRRSVAASSPSS